MADPRHKHAAKPLRRPRTSRWSRASRSILPVAGLLTLFVAGGAVVVAEDQAPATIAAAPTNAAAPTKDVLANASQNVSRVSRSAERAPIPNEADAEDKIESRLFAVEQVAVHTAAKDSSPVLATVDSGDKVDVTGVVKGDWAQIMHKGLPRWVPSKNLAEKMPPPPPPPPPPLGTSPCVSGSAVENGVQPDTVRVHRAVCEAFPSIVRWGGLRGGGGEHSRGRALDIMVSSNVGTAIADFTREHASELGVSEVIWRQRIWTRQRAGDGWRSMSDRGGATANHMDHVHVTTYGDAGTG